MKRNDILKDCVRLANEYGGRCLSNKYVDCKTKLLWECKFFHVWEATRHAVKSCKTWCPYCAKNRKHDIEYCKTVAKNMKGLCLGKIYTNNRTKMLWQCEYKHKFYSRFDDILGGHWCPECYGNVSFTIHDCEMYAKKLHGKCLSKEYTGVSHKIKWSCKNGHIWFAAFHDINRGGWCPSCVYRKSQSKLKNIIRNIVGKVEIKENFKGFDWLVNPATKRRLEIDIWVPDLKLAVEYDGEQHFMPVKFGSSMTDDDAIEKLKYQKNIDKIKNEVILQHSDEVRYFIRFAYNENISNKFVYAKIKQSGAII